MKYDHLISFYDAGKCCSLLIMVQNSAFIGWSCEKRSRMQVFFSSINTADRMILSRKVLTVQPSSFSSQSDEKTVVFKWISGYLERVSKIHIISLSDALSCVFV